jgi:hypothetical protein
MGKVIKGFQICLLGQHVLLLVNLLWVLCARGSKKKSWCLEDTKDETANQAVLLVDS